MSHTKVNIVTELANLSAQVKATKQNGTYAAQQQHFDDEVQKSLNKWCPIAEHNVHNSVQLVTTLHQQAKQAMGLVESTLKAKEFSKSDLELVEHLPAKVQQCIARFETDGEELTHANIQYRENWAMYVREASPASVQLADRFVATRNAQIDAQSGTMALKKRIREYLTRSEEFVKQARQRAKGGVEIEAFQHDVAAIKQKMLDGKAEILGFYDKKKSAIANIKAIEKTKVWTADQAKNAKGYLVGIVSSAKSARGQMKTLGVLFDGLEKRGKAAGAGWKDVAAKAVLEAAKPYKEAGELAKEFNAAEERCVKTCKDHGVTV